MKRIFFGLVALFTFALLVTPSFADTTCQPIYGGGQTCVQTGNIVINKTVQNPSTGAFVDNLGVNDPKFGPDQTVTFQLTVTNTGGSTLDKVTVKDIFPQFVSFLSGPGSFDTNNKTLTFDVTSLAANETRTFTLTGKVAPSNDLPSDQTVTCVVNQSKATSGNQNSQDNAQFCLQKQGVAVGGGAASSTPQPMPIPPSQTKGGLPVVQSSPMQTTPATGPEALALFGLLPAAGIGALLRKKSK